MRADPSTPAVRVAVVVHGDRVPRPVAYLVTRLAERPDVALTLIEVHQRTSGATDTRRGLGYRLADALRDLWLRVDRRVFRPAEDGLVLVALPGRSTVPRLAATDATRIATLGLDVILDPGLERSADGAGLGSTARLGRWTLTPETDGWPLAAGEMRRGSHTLRAWVARDGATAPGAILAEAIVPSSPHSLARNQSLVRWQGVHLALRLLARVDASAEPPHLPPADTHPLLAADAPAPVSGPPVHPGLGGTLGLLARVGVRLVRRALTGLLFESEWFVAIRPRQDDTLPADLRGFQPIAVAPGYIADPHLVADEPHDRLFVEQWDRAAGRGRIGVLDMDPAIATATHDPAIVLETATHLSYPSIVEWHGERWLLPENWAGERLELFRATSYPTGWTREATLLDGVRAADPTVIEHEGRLWLFVTLTEPGLNPWDELSLFWADDLRGPWQPHPANPVVSDVRRARPAGPIVVTAHGLIRPAQDCAAAYGRRIVLHRIERLDPEAYVETPISTIEPTGLRGLERTHSYSRSDRWEAVDGRRRRLRAVPGMRRARADRGDEAAAAAARTLVSPEPGSPRSSSSSPGASGVDPA